MTFNKPNNQKQFQSQSNNNRPKNISYWRTKKLSSKERSDQEQIVILQNGQAIFSKLQTSKKLLSFQIYSKMIGIDSSSKNISQFICEPFLIDKYACAFILKNNIIGYNKKNSNELGVNFIQKLQKDKIYLIYQNFVKQRHLFLIDGHKFGGQFLAYEHNPDSNHATYLIFIKKQRDQFNMTYVSRLAGICRKQALIVDIVQNKENPQKTQIICQQIEPRYSEHKKHVPAPKGTPQLLLLKKLIGYK